MPDLRWWEIHYNPHGVRRIWVGLPDGQLTQIPWIDRDDFHSLMVAVSCSRAVQAAAG
ncbi:hypothetical protein AB0M97_16065 [Streptomyces sp. NPDC051207]|uniref:hypothetical protein n=1 Tax=Streptomyces sp. NPDC051207 TaxID=3154641 RepID=UPI0034215771